MIVVFLCVRVHLSVFASVANESERGNGRFVGAMDTHKHTQSWWIRTYREGGIGRKKGERWRGRLETPIDLSLIQVAPTHTRSSAHIRGFSVALSAERWGTCLVIIAVMSDTEDK